MQLVHCERRLRSVSLPQLATIVSGRRHSVSGGLSTNVLVPSSGAAHVGFQPAAHRVHTARLQRLGAHTLGALRYCTSSTFSCIIIGELVSRPLSLAMIDAHTLKSPLVKPLQLGCCADCSFGGRRCWSKPPEALPVARSPLCPALG